MTIVPIVDKESVYIRLYHKNKKVLIHSGVCLSSSHWNPIKKQVRRSYKGYKLANQKINDLTEKLWEIWDEGQVNSVNGLQQAYLSESKEVEVELTFLSFVQRLLKQSTSYSDKKKYNTMIGWLERFNPNIMLNGWTDERLDQFQDMLKQSDTINSQYYVAKLLQRISTVLNKAIRYRLIGYNDSPFKMGYKVKRGVPKDIKLEMIELKTLWENRNSLPNKSYRLAVQIFLLSFLLDGTRFRDVFLLRNDAIGIDRVLITASKTGKSHEVRLTGKIKVILNEIVNEGIYVIPLAQNYADKGPIADQQIESANAYINKYLKKAARLLNINESISMHVARHTFAYLAATTLDYSLLELQSALNHSSVQLTRDYIGRIKGDPLQEKRGRLHDLL